MAKRPMDKGMEDKRMKGSWCTRASDLAVIGRGCCASNTRASALIGIRAGNEAYKN